MCDMSGARRAGYISTLSGLYLPPTRDSQLAGGRAQRGFWTLARATMDVRILGACRLCGRASFDLRLDFCDVRVTFFVHEKLTAERSRFNLSRFAR